MGIFSLLAGVGLLAFTLRDDVTRVIADLPAATQKLRATVRAGRVDQQPGTLDHLQEAADEIQRTAKEAAGEAPQRGVMKVEVAEPAFSAGDYILWGSTRGVLFASQGGMILFLAYFLLLSDDLFKRKLVEHMGALASKKITVEILNEVASQIERFLVVQVFTSAVVGVVTGLTLWWLGVQNPGVWGLVAGVFNSVPYFGPLIVTAVLTVVAFVQFGTVSMALTVGGSTLAITALEGWFYAHADGEGRANQYGRRLRRLDLLELVMGSHGHAARGAHHDGHQGDLRSRRRPPPGGEPARRLRRVTAAASPRGASSGGASHAT